MLWLRSQVLHYGAGVCIYVGREDTTWVLSIGQDPTPCPPGVLAYFIEFWHWPCLLVGPCQHQTPDGHCPGFCTAHLGTMSLESGCLKWGPMSGPQEKLWTICKSKINSINCDCQPRSRSCEADSHDFTRPQQVKATFLTTSVPLA